MTNPEPATLAEMFSLHSETNLSPRYNIAPTQSVATVVRTVPDAHNRLALMRWGLIPRWAKASKIGSRMINARGETVHEKPSFRAALRLRRCLIVADGFYEWQAQPEGPKQPLFITLHNRALFGMAGLWEEWAAADTGEVLTTCTIITTTPNDLIAAFHTRMPAILPRAAYAAWLDPAQTDPHHVRPLLKPYPTELMTAYPVSRRVNNPKHDDPTLIAHVG